MDDLPGPLVHLILGVRQGHGFDFLQTPVFVEAGLNGNHLDTDVTAPAPEPQFDAELLFVSDKKSFRRLRTGNVPLKVECFSLVNGHKRDRIGYVLLSLRGAQMAPNGQQINIRESWHRLLGVRPEFKHLGPELLLSLRVEDLHEYESAPPITQQSVRLSFNQPPISNIYTQRSLKQPIMPQVENEEGIIQIGPRNQASDFYLLSILVGVASNLDLLIADNINPALQVDGDEYYFSYNMLGYTIQTKSFSLDGACEVPANEKIVVRLRSSLYFLKLYFTNISVVILHLMFGHQEVGFTEMDVKTLVPTDDLTEFCTHYAVNNTVTSENRCLLAGHTTSEVPVGLDGTRPFVNIILKLKLVKENSKQTASELHGDYLTESQQTRSGPAYNQYEQKLGAYHQSSGDRPPRRAGIPRITTQSANRQSSSAPQFVPQTFTQSRANTVSQSERSLPPAPSIHPQECSLSEPPSRRHLLSVQSSQQVMYLLQPSADCILSDSQGGPQCADSDGALNSGRSTAYHNYTLYISLVNAVFLKFPPQRKIFFKFHHPKAEVISTVQPEIKVEELEKVIPLRDMQCRLDFVTLPEEISRHLLTWPPKVSVCDTINNEVVKLATTTLDTAPLLTKEKKEIFYTTVLEDVGTGKKIGELEVSLSLEDRGVRGSDEKILRSSTSEQELSPPVLDDRIAYRLVEELEEWKEQQKDEFLSKLRHKEEEHLNSLLDEWMRRRNDLEATLTSNVSECQSLSESLRTTTEDLRKKLATVGEQGDSLQVREQELRKATENLERREEDLRRREEDLRRREEDLRRREEELYKKSQDGMSVTGHSCYNTDQVNDYGQQAQESKSKCELLEKENKILRDTLKEQEIEINKMQKGILTKDQTKSLLQDLKSMEEKLENALKSKSFFKEQWSRAVKEIHRIKSEHQEAIQIQIKHNKEELKTLGLHQVLGEGEMQLQSDKQTLQQLRSEMATGLGRGDGTSQVLGPSSSKEESESRIQTLVQERDALLSTGSYTLADEVILRLNEEIRTLLLHSNDVS